jgi:hypothetical protein
MPNIKFVRKELKDMLPLYDTVRDCLDGEVTVKSKGTKRERYERGERPSLQVV